MIMHMHIWFAQTPMIINYTYELGRVYVEGKYGNPNSINLKYGYILPLPTTSHCHWLDSITHRYSDFLQNPSFEQLIFCI